MLAGQLLDPTIFKNPLASGALLVAIGGAVIAYAKSLPTAIGRWLLDRFTVELDTISGSQGFNWLEAWLEAQPYAARSRRLTLDVHWTDNGEVATLAPGVGTHLFRIGKRPVWLVRNRTDKDNGIGGPRETFTLRILGRSQETARAIVEAARAAYVKKGQSLPVVYTSSTDGWHKSGTIPDRPLATIFLPEGVAERVRDDLATFLNAKAWYRQRGVPYRRGYLLHGAPGTGKTSLVGSLAYELRLSLYVLNLSSFRDDSEMLASLSRVPAGAAVVLEDIDAAQESRVASAEPEEPHVEDEAPRRRRRGRKTDFGTGISLSGLLNALDGLVARDGAIVFMTTNHLERLDPALRRAGRADVVLEFGPATKDQAERAFRAFFPEYAGLAIRFAQTAANGARTMAEIQQLLLTHREDAGAAATALELKAA